MYIQDDSKQHTYGLQNSTPKWAGRQQMLLPDTVKKHPQYYKKMHKRSPGTDYYLKDKQNV